MSKINDFVNKIGEDKGLHMFLAGDIALAVKEFVFILAGTGWAWHVYASLIGMACAMGLELFKEYVLDDNPDWGDILFSFFGSCFPLITTALAFLCAWLW